MSLTSAEVDVCNQALDKFGSAIFTFADQTTNEALKCNRHYEQTRNALLRSYEWPFASERVELDTYGIGEIVYYNGGIVTYEDETVYYGVTYYEDDFEWDNQFGLPSDFLRLISVYEVDDKSTVPRNRYALAGTRLLTNFETIHIRYIKKVTDPDDFDALFTELLILALALKLMPALAGTKTAELRKDIKEEFKVLNARARAVCRTETNTSGYSGWNRARLGSGII